MLQARYPKGSSPSDNGKPFKTVRKTSLQIQSAIIALENSTAALPPVKPAIKIPLKAKNYNQRICSEQFNSRLQSWRQREQNLLSTSQHQVQQRPRSIGEHLPAPLKPQQYRNKKLPVNASEIDSLINSNNTPTIQPSADTKALQAKQLDKHLTVVAYQLFNQNLSSLFSQQAKILTVQTQLLLRQASLRKNPAKEIQKAIQTAPIHTVKPVVSEQIVADKTEIMPTVSQLPRSGSDTFESIRSQSPPLLVLLSDIHPSTTQPAEDTANNTTNNNGDFVMFRLHKILLRALKAPFKRFADRRSSKQQELKESRLQESKLLRGWVEKSNGQHSANQSQFDLNHYMQVERPVLIRKAVLACFTTRNE